MKCVELFAGAGGASLGLHRAGFTSLMAVEWDKDASGTLRALGHGPVHEGDVRDLDVSTIPVAPDLLWASPPCQAWSTSGKRLGSMDDRNGWPWTLDVIDRLRAEGKAPRWVLCENVPGILQHVEGCVSSGNPEECAGCYWERVILVEFRRRYAHVDYRTLNTADYGVPQKRRRVVLAAGPEPFPWPAPTHSFANLVYDKWVSGDYWTQRGIPKPARGPSPSESRELGVRMASRTGRPDEGQLPYVTMRDALGLQYPIRHQSPSALAVQHLPDEVAPSVSGKGTLYAEREVQAVGGFNPHYHGEDAQVEARVNRGTRWGEVQTTITTRVRGSGGGVFDLFGEEEEPVSLAPAGTDPIVESVGRRRLTYQECAILQGFPPDHPWVGLATSRYRQVGNAVPPPLAEALGRAVASL